MDFEEGQTGMKRKREQERELEREWKCERERKYTVGLEQLLYKLSDFACNQPRPFTSRKSNVKRNEMTGSCEK